MGSAASGQRRVSEVPHHEPHHLSSASFAVVVARFEFKPQPLVGGPAVDGDNLSATLRCSDMNTPQNPSASVHLAGAEPATQDVSVSSERLSQLIKIWNNEHIDLSKNIQDTSVWLGQVSQLGRPRFGELAARLRVMRERMKRHFEREELLGQDLRQVANCVEAVSSSRRASNDHQHLLQRVDELISKLRELEPPFDSFQQAIDQVSLFVDAFEQHEEQEAAGLQWLTHTNSDSRRSPR